MNRTERLVVGMLVAAVLLSAPAFLLHSSARFAGSPWGAVFGGLAALCMMVLLVYPLMKHSVSLRQRFARFDSMKGILRLHVFIGVIGVLLAIVHTGHKYQSSLGISLTVTMILVVLTGFVSGYYLPLVSTELADQQKQLTMLRQEYDRLGMQAASAEGRSGSQVSLLGLVEGIADLELAIGARSALRWSFSAWTVAHVLLSLLMYFLLTVHIAAEVYFGLRWLP
jgi:hypothetical protein